MVPIRCLSTLISFLVGHTLLPGSVVGLQSSSPKLQQQTQRIGYQRLDQQKVVAVGFSDSSTHRQLAAAVGASVTTRLQAFKLAILRSASVSFFIGLSARVITAGFNVHIPVYVSFGRTALHLHSRIQTRGWFR